LYVFITYSVTTFKKTHRIPVWCETGSVTLREELRLRMFENRDLKRIFGPKREEVAQ
jgi:hypothetical protein